MFEIKKQQNYKAFADELEKSTGCSIKIEVMKDEEHYHYEFNKNGITLGVLCYQNGDVGFAPFVKMSDSSAMKNDNLFINVKFAPSFDDFAKVLLILQSMFVE